MKHLKTLSVALVAVTALVMFIGAGSASAATTLCKANENPCAAGNTYGMKTNIEATLEAGQKAILQTASFKAECGKSELKTTYEDNSVGGNPTGKVSVLTFEECGKCSAKALAAGSVEFTTEKAASNGNGILNGSGMELTVECGGTGCIMTTKAGGQGIGLITGGNPAKLQIATNMAWKAGDANEVVCGKIMSWEGKYEITSPKPLFII